MKDWIESYLEFLLFHKRYSAHTITAYRNDLFALADYCELFYEIKSPGEVNRRIISSFVAGLAESGVAPRTLNRKLSAIKSFYTHLIKVGDVTKNPVENIQRPKMSARLPSVVRSEQVELLFRPGNFPDSFEGSRDLALLSVFYACGLRRDELINLRCSSVDFDTGQIKVLGKRNKERIIPIAENLIRILNAYLEHRGKLNEASDYLFLTKKGQKMSPNLVYNIVKIYLANVTTMEKKSPHVLRHTFATHLLNQGANLQSIKELLGHESLATTQVYTHTSIEQLKSIYKQAHPRSKK